MNCVNTDKNFIIIRKIPSEARHVSKMLMRQDLYDRYSTVQYSTVQYRIGTIRIMYYIRYNIQYTLDNSTTS